MNIVSFGGGTNSPAMIIGLYQRHEPIDLILFADTGAEFPHTYRFLMIFNDWLAKHGLPFITTVQYRDRNGNRLTLEQECLRSGTLPSIAYGHKQCSQKHKIAPQDKFCNHYPPCLETWKQGQKVVKFIGYDSGEQRRYNRSKEYASRSKKYDYRYPLVEWGWDRERCKKEIKEAGLPLPGKTSCFFCPSMHKEEILNLQQSYPFLLDRALAIEERAQPNLKKIKGLGRDFSWKDFLNTGS